MGIVACFTGALVEQPVAFSSLYCFDFPRFLLRASQPLPMEIFLSHSVPDTRRANKMFLLI
jgi:hypothetical protein